MVREYFNNAVKREKDPHPGEISVECEKQCKEMGPPNLIAGSLQNDYSVW